MRIFLVLCMAFIATVFVAGCVTQARLDGRYKELLMAWVAAHPGEELTEEADAQIKAEALKQVEAEVAQERKDALSGLAGILGAVSTGNWIGAAVGAVGLGAIGMKQLGKGSKS